VGRKRPHGATCLICCPPERPSRQELQALAELHEIPMDRHDGDLAEKVLRDPYRISARALWRKISKGRTT